MASINDSESPGEDVGANSFAIGDLAGFLTPLDEALFSDFLKLASYLYSEGYRDAAAVVCIGVLEGHLRKLSEKLEIVVTADNGLPKKADVLNAELAARGAYSRLDEENVSAWLGLRNYAGHEENERYARNDVAFLLEGVRSLLNRYPA